MGGAGECLWKECALFPGDPEPAGSSDPPLNPTQSRSPPNCSHTGAQASYFLGAGKGSTKLCLHYRRTRQAPQSCWPWAGEPGLHRGSPGLRPPTGIGPDCGQASGEKKVAAKFLPPTLHSPRPLSPLGPRPPSHSPNCLPALMGGSVEVLPQIKLNVSQAGRLMMREEIPHLHSPAPGQGGPGPERQRSKHSGRDGESQRDTDGEAGWGRKKEAA